MPNDPAFRGIFTKHKRKGVCVKNKEPQIPEEQQSNENFRESILIQCEKISLRECNLVAINSIEHKNDPELKFAVQPVVFGDNHLLSELKICLVNNNVNPKANLGFILNFTYMAVFSGPDTLTKEQMGEFGQLYTLSTLWPYAREFAQNIFLRTNFQTKPLPIINPTSTTAEMINQGLINVIYQDGDPTKQNFL
jgi:preprotein translocase subunit SecB